MPTRFIRESCRTSPTLAQISPEAERLFWRLLTVADDHGRFEADPMIVVAQCFSAMLDRIPLADADTWLQMLASVNLVTLYVVAGKPYGEFVTWRKHQRSRAKHSKYPGPEQRDLLPSADIGGHPLPFAASSDLRPPTFDTPTSDSPDGKPEHLSVELERLQAKFGETR